MALQGGFGGAGGAGGARGGYGAGAGNYVGAVPCIGIGCKGPKLLIRNNWEQ